MLVVEAALKGYAIQASDGRMGTVKTFLFDDRSWNIRWLVVDTGHWLTDRQVLVHPSAIGLADHSLQVLHVGLTKAQIEASPDIQQDAPVTMQMERQLHSYYGWDPYWGPEFYGTGFADLGLPGIGTADGFGMRNAGGHGESGFEGVQFGSDDGDPHLRSMTSTNGYHLHATDGGIGHVENFLIDDITWSIRYLIADTSNWWMGKHVLIAPFAVESVDWSKREIHLNVSRDAVKASPPWDPIKIVEAVYERELHAHYRWPGYGWASMGETLADIARREQRERPLLTVRHGPDGLARRCKIAIEGLDFYYGAIQALKHVCLNVREHQVLGQRATGRVTLDGDDILGPEVDLRVLRSRVGMVFQGITVFPMSIFDNVAFGIRLHEHLSHAELAERVEETLMRVALWGEVKDRLRE
eukprot:gene4307-4357_t